MSVGQIGQNTVFNTIPLQTPTVATAATPENVETTENDKDTDDMAIKGGNAIAPQTANVTSAQATGGILGSILDFRA